MGDDNLPPTPVADGYARLRLRGPLLYSPSPSRTRSLVFIDLDLRGEPLDSAPAALLRMRELPHELFLGCRVLLIRFPDELQTLGEEVAKCDDMVGLLTEQLAILNLELAIGATVTGLLRFQSASNERGEMGIATDVQAPDLDELLSRARSAELATLLQRGNGLWRPNTYHYRLPSGRHAGAFVRLANAFREPRDTYALGTWLATDLPLRAGVLIDTAGLTPLVQAAQELQRAAGGEPGPVSSMASYPATQFDTDRAIRAFGVLRPVRAIVSVSSSGDVLDRIVRAAETYAEAGWGVDVLVARGRGPGESITPEGEAIGIPRVRPNRSTQIWAGLGDVGAAAGDACGLCLDERTARIVQIDPRSFEGLILPDPKLLMPSISDAFENRRLWEIADATGSAQVQSPPDKWREKLRPVRSNRQSRMSLRVDLDLLIQSPSLWSEIEQRLTQDSVSFGSILHRILSGMVSGSSEAVPPDVILVDQHDHDRGQKFKDIADSLSSLIGSTVVISADPAKPQEDWDLETLTALKGAKHVLIFALGSVSGYGLQRLLLGVQEHRRLGDNYLISGLVMHARPTSDRQWKTLFNSYGQRLWSIWKSLLPDWSPFDDEAALFDNLPDLSGDPEVEAFIQMRVDFCNGNFPNLPAAPAEGAERDAPPDVACRYVPLLWGMPKGYGPEARIRQMSIFGHQLGSQALHMATAAAVQNARDPGPTPTAAEWALFEMRAMLRSYYDPLILASMLRWLRPGEMWWGADSGSGVAALDELFARTPEPDMTILLPELLLAASMGKLSRSGAQRVLALCESVLAGATSPPWGADSLVPLRAAIHIWRSHTTPRPTADQGLAGSLSAYRVLSQDDEQTAERILATLRGINGVESVLQALHEHMSFVHRLAFLLSPTPGTRDSPLGLLVTATPTTFVGLHEKVVAAATTFVPS